MLPSAFLFPLYQLFIYFLNCFKYSYLKAFQIVLSSQALETEVLLFVLHATLAVAQLLVCFISSDCESEPGDLFPSWMAHAAWAVEAPSC